LGAFGEKVSTNAEWLAFWAAAAVNPTADLISNSVSVDIS
jgi:hypothetical protein